jgi:hypothetical protein
VIRQAWSVYGPSRHCEVGRFRSHSGLPTKIERSRMTRRRPLAVHTARLTSGAETCILPRLAPCLASTLVAWDLADAFLALAPRGALHPDFGHRCGDLLALAERSLAFVRAAAKALGDDFVTAGLIDREAIAARLHRATIEPCARRSAARSHRARGAPASTCALVPPGGRTLPTSPIASSVGGSSRWTP